MYKMCETHRFTRNGFLTFFQFKYKKQIVKQQKIYTQSSKIRLEK